MASAAPNTDVKVGSYGTSYFLPTYDVDTAKVNFDPTGYAIKQIIFKMPQPDGTYKLLTRTGTSTTRTINDVVVNGLQYVVLQADVAAYVSGSVGGFHTAPGPVSMEGFVSDGSTQAFPSATVTKDSKGRDLEVVARLAA